MNVSLDGIATGIYQSQTMIFLRNNAVYMMTYILNTETMLRKVFLRMLSWSLIVMNG